jgi:chromosome segregation ATPase
MPPKHRQLHAPHPKASGNAYQALVDTPHDGKSLSFDGGDERTDGYANNTVVNANPRDSGPPTPTHSQDIVLQWIGQNILNLETQIQACTTRMESALAAGSEENARLNSKMDSLLQKMDAAWTENTALREAYHASRDETAALKAAVDTLTKKLDENIATTVPPSPETVTSSTAMEEMTMQLSNVQHDIQDILDAVRNPPGKRKRHTSNQDNEPTTPTNRRPATQRHHDASLEHSLMHSCHAISTTQEALDALMIKYPLCQLAIDSTSAKPTPPPGSSATQDTPLPKAPTTAPAETEGWKTVEGKATQRKKRNEEANKKRAKETSDKPPTTKNSGRGKNSHQP